MVTRRGNHGPGGGVGAWLAELALPLAVLAALNLYIIGFLGAERTLYHADQVAYWSYASDLAAGLRARPAAALLAVARSVPSAELNLLPALPVSLVMAFFGTSRTVYVLAVLNIYGLALVLALVGALRLLTTVAARPPPLARGLSVTAALLLFPTVWRPVLLGYIGLGGVALGALILAAYLHISQTGSRWHHLLLIGFLLAMLALYRRWYTIWVLAFGLTVGAETCWRLARGAWRDRGRLWAVVRPPLLIAVVAISTVLLVAAPLVMHRLQGGYAQEFAAYARHGPLSARLGSVIAQFGLLPLGVAGLAAAVLLRSPADRRTAVLVPLQAVLAWAVMIRIQGHSPQHWYLYLPALLLLAVLGLARLLAAGGVPRSVVAVTTVAALTVGGVGTAAVLAPGRIGLPASCASLVSRNRVRPLVRDDLAEVRRLLSFLDRLERTHPGYIYVLGSGGVLSDHVLAFANRSLGTGFSSLPLILASSHLDRRDGFPRGLLQARYVVVPDPPQLGMASREQQVVLVPTQSFLTGANVARAFRRLPQRFLLDGGVRVQVFEKVRPIADDEVRELSAELRRAHPDLPKVWTP